jgi:hypothetical protein
MRTGRSSSPYGWSSRYRRRHVKPSDGPLECVRTLAQMAEQVAAGDSASFVTLDVARALIDLLSLRDCRYETFAEAISAGSPRPVLRHDGELEMRRARWNPVPIGLPPNGFDIVLSVRGQPQGRFVCTPRRRTPVAEERVLAALALVDQAASARLIELIS